MTSRAKQRFYVLLLGLLVTCLGCSTLRWVGRQSEGGVHGHIREPPCAKLKRDLDELTKSLLLLPYTKRSQLVALYGEPFSTLTNDYRLLVDTYQLPEGLTLRTYFTAQDTASYDSFQWADFCVSNDSGWNERPSRFEWPEPLQDTGATAKKIALLRKLKARLIRESKPLTATETFQTGTVVRTYTTIEHFNWPVGEEVWRRNGEVVARGRYRDFRRWEGSFLLELKGGFSSEEDSQNQAFFRKVIYKEGVLQHSLVPDWEERRNEVFRQSILHAGDKSGLERGEDHADLDPFAAPRWRSMLFGDPFVSGPRSKPCLDQAAFESNKGLLKLCRETPFLEWAEENGVTEGYRVVISPTFTPAIVVNIALASKGIEPKIRWKVTSGEAGYPETVTNVSFESERLLSRSEVRELRDILEKSVFWSQDREYSVGAPDGWCLDYEGVRDGRYVYRHYFNTDACASEALAFKVLAMLPPQAKEWPRPWVVPIKDQYLWNLGECFRDSIRVLEHFGRTEVVDDMLFRPGPATAFRGIRVARSLLSDKLKEVLVSDFEVLQWGGDGETLVHTNGAPIAVVCKKEVAIWDGSLMFDFTFSARTNVNGVTARPVSIKLTPTATALHIRASTNPKPLSPVALSILARENLNPLYATVIQEEEPEPRASDSRDAFGSAGTESGEIVFVTPPAELAGALSYRMVIDRRERKYCINKSGGLSTGGSTRSADFDASW